MKKTFKPVLAAEEDPFALEDADDAQNMLDDATDAIDDLQDAVAEVSDQPEDAILDMDNNIDNHYIAECQRCHEIFISAVVESETRMESVHGECPCCHEQTEQDLKWIVRSVNYEEDIANEQY